MAKWESIEDDANEIAETIMVELRDAAADARDADLDREERADARERAETAWREAWVAMTAIGRRAGWDPPV